MRNKLLFLICMVTSLSGTIYASNSNLQNVTWISPDNHFYLTTVEDVVLYKVNKIDAGEYPPKDLSQEQNSTRRVTYLGDHKKKSIRKSTEVEVVGLLNAKMQLYYDTYLVVYSGELYYMPKECVATNVELEEVNKSLDKTFAGLIDEKELLDNDIYNATQVIESYRILSESKLEVYSIMHKSLPHIIDSIEQKAILDYKTQCELEYNKRYNNWAKSLTSSARTAIKTIAIRSARLSSPNSAGGCDYSFYYTNKSNKTIKYLTWNGSVYNAVDDRVSCDIRHTSSVGGRDTGPVEFDERGGGSWSNVIYNYSADRVKLFSIYIQYMDGSTYSIKESDMELMLSEPSKETDWSAQKLIKEGAALQQKSDLKRYKDSVAYWEKRVSIMQRTNNLSNIGYSALALETMPECVDMQSNLQKLHIMHEVAVGKIERFQRDNFMNNAVNSISEKQLEETREESKYDSKFIKRVSIGFGADWLMSGDYMGGSFPLEVLFGSTDQRLNFSVSGVYTTLGSYGSLSLNQLSAAAMLHLNVTKGRTFSLPFSVGVGCNANRGEPVYNVTGYYYDDSFKKTSFSAPLFMNKNNLSTTVSFGARWRHGLFALYMRFDLTPVYDKGYMENYIPDGEYVFYDDFLIGNVIDASASLPLFGISYKYYF